MKLLSNVLKIAKTEFTCVKLLPKKKKIPTYISFKLRMSDGLFEKSMDSAVWPNDVAIREFVDRPRKFLRARCRTHTSLDLSSSGVDAELHF
jgi:hypothetical protein